MKKGFYGRDEKKKKPVNSALIVNQRQSCILGETEDISFTTKDLKDAKYVDSY